jgi:hypothetical protein
MAGELKQHRLDMGTSLNALTALHPQSLRRSLWTVSRSGWQ